MYDDWITFINMSTASMLMSSCCRGHQLDYLTELFSGLINTWAYNQAVLYN